MAEACASVLSLDRISWPGSQTDLVFRSALGRYRAVLFLSPSSVMATN